MKGNFEICLICGEYKVNPIFEVNVEVGIYHNYGKRICEDCMNSNDPEIVKEVIQIYNNNNNIPF